MRVLEFRCTELNAFLDYHFRFHRDVSFLYGINGSGKTSVLRAIASLLTPDPFWLFNTDYKELHILFEHLGERTRISAVRTDKRLSMQIAGSVQLSEEIDLDDARLAVGRTLEEDFRTIADTDEWALRSRYFVERFKTFSQISALPTPIFLGLDRTTLTQGTIKHQPRSRRSRSIHPYFRTQLDDAMQEAERLLAQQLSALSIERNKIFAALRNEFVLSLFQIPTSRSQSLLDVNKDKFKKRQEEMRNSVINALQKINIGSNKINDVVEPFFEEMKRVWDLASQAVPPSHDDQKALVAYFEKVTPQLNFKPYISIIEGTLSKIEEANNKDRELYNTVESYQNIMNSFFGDSNKYLLLDENTVNVLLPTGKITDITSLSSGERQIFVLITHLVFNPAMHGENILLIDEPELSLHLKWQRQFVSSVRDASPSTQMILATHSPEIIFDLHDHLIPLSA